MYMMVSGDRAELRGLNLEGMRRLGFSEIEVKSIHYYRAIPASSTIYSTLF